MWDCASGWLEKGLTRISVRRERGDGVKSYHSSVCVLRGSSGLGRRIGKKQCRLIGRRSEGPGEDPGDRSTVEL